MVSKSDYWNFIRSRFDDEILDDLKSIAQVTLKDNDGSFELPSADRWLAPIYGKTTQYSAKVKSGISDSLALLSSI